MKKFKINFVAVFSLLVCAIAFVFAGCGGQKKNPDDIVGVYTAAQVAVSYNDHVVGDPPSVYNIDAENNESNVIKELSRILYEEFGGLRYEIKKSSNGYIFETQELNAQNVFVTISASLLNAEARENSVVLKSQGGGEWHEFNFKNGVVYFCETQHCNNVGNSDFPNVELKEFMVANNIEAANVRYVLEK